MEAYIKDFLESNSLPYVLHKHQAVFTCEEADVHCKHVPGIPCKNLFLKDKKGKNFYLVIVPAKKRVRMDNLAEILNLKKLRFANEGNLKEILGLAPGSVSILGLINDKEKKVHLVIDKEIWNSEVLSFHPNINTASLEFTRENFHKLAGILCPNYQLVSV